MAERDDDRVEGLTRDHGRVVSVSTQRLGTTLTAPTAAGATVLPVYDVGHFDAKNGGTLSVNGSQLAYSTCDDDTDTITLSDPLPADALEGDRVDCWSTLYDAAFTKKTAMVQLDGDDDNPDPLECYVPHSLADKISDGDRGGPGESVVIEYDEDQDEWRIADVRGLASTSGAGVKFCNTDTYAVTTAGDQTILLSHTPLPESLDVKWHPDGLGGIPLASADWTLSGSTLTVPDPNGLVAVGDLIDPLYAYRDGPVAQTLPPSATLRGGVYTADPATTSLALPTDTQVGDLIVVAFAAMTASVTSGTATVTDGRLTQIAHNTWIGTASNLNAVSFSNPNDDLRMTASIATYAPMDHGSVTVAQAGAAAGSIAAPVVNASAALLVVTSECPNSVTNRINSVPSGYIADEVAPTASVICNANIYHWVGDFSATSSPSGSITYSIQSQGEVYATAVALSGR